MEAKPKSSAIPENPHRKIKGFRFPAALPSSHSVRRLSLIHIFHRQRRKLRKQPPVALRPDRDDHRLRPGNSLREIAPERESLRQGQ